MSAKTRTKTFKVEGLGRFPVDMLRYDSCWPKSQEDSRKIENSLSEFSRFEVEVTLETWAPDAPTVAKWKSFGWEVV